MKKMSQSQSGLSRFFNRIRYGLVLLSLRDALIRLGIESSLFYWMREDVPVSGALSFDSGFDEYNFSFFDAVDIKIISDLPERSSVSSEHIKRIFAGGAKCFGAKYKGEIAGFTWIDQQQCFSRFYKIPMRQNEAYLFDVYVLKAFRGRGLALAMRCKIYDIFRPMGIETFYSIVEIFNRPSIRTNQRLNAKRIFLGLFVRLFNRRKKTWVIKRYV